MLWLPNAKFSGFWLFFHRKSKGRLQEAVYCLIGCLGFNGPLRQYFRVVTNVVRNCGPTHLLVFDFEQQNMFINYSIYIGPAVSQREGE